MTGSQDGSRYRVAVDAMGGDHAPEEIVRGALDAAALGNVEILLVGEAEALSAMLPPSPPDTLTLAPAVSPILT